VIRIAIVAPVDRFDKPPAGPFHKGSIWVSRRQLVHRRHCLECLTPAGVRLETSALLERFLTKRIEVFVVCPTNANAPMAKTLAELVPEAPVFAVDRSYKYFSAHRSRNGKDLEGAPFRLGLRGHKFERFEPAWYEPPPPPILLKSLSGDFYTYPSTDGLEDGEGVEIEESPVDDPEATKCLGLLGTINKNPENLFASSRYRKKTK
jgi:hypothetical protein